MHRIDSFAIFVTQTVGRDSRRELIKRAASKQGREVRPMQPVRCSHLSLKQAFGPEVTNVMDGIHVVGLDLVAK